jgi:hypothetical protein
MIFCLYHQNLLQVKKNWTKRWSTGDAQFWTLPLWYQVLAKARLPLSLICLPRRNPLIFPSLSLFIKHARAHTTSIFSLSVIHPRKFPPVIVDRVSCSRYIAPQDKSTHSKANRDAICCTTLTLPPGSPLKNSPAAAHITAAVSRTESNEDSTQ